MARGEGNADCRFESEDVHGGYGDGERRWERVRSVAMNDLIRARLAIKVRVMF